MRILEQLFASLFTPVFELLGDVPPRALDRLLMPF
jgi:hypothetical protein